MIGRLAGTLVAVEPEAVLVDVNGVGYVVGVSTRTLAALPPPGAAVTLTIETMVREDAITLYGFLDPAERAAFRTLLTVQGVGAKVALALLGAFSPGQIAAAVATGDAKTLTRASGVGARLAARLVTELEGQARLRRRRGDPGRCRARAAARPAARRRGLGARQPGLPPRRGRACARRRTPASR